MVTLLSLHTVISNVQRHFLKIVFPITVVALLICIYHLMTIVRVPQGPDLCNYLKDVDGRKDIPRQWWEWPCLLEKEWHAGLEFACKDIRTMGNYHICFDEPYKPEPPCIVYSFGIDNDFTFDDAMAEAGCEVFSFDPSMGVNDHQRSERVHFFNIGLSTLDSDNFVPLLDGYTQNTDQTWKIRKLASLKKMLGHENKTLDVLKLDIETYEWAILKHWLQDGSLNYIKQLAMEWHIFPNEPMRTEFHSMYQTYKGMQEIGYRLFFLEFGKTLHNRFYFNMQVDTSQVNTLFKQPKK